MAHSSAVRVIALAGIIATMGFGARAFADGTKPTDPALVGEWRLDDGRGDVVADSSGHDHEGQILGAEWVRGRFGTALHFGGHDAYVSIPGITGLDGSNELTVEAWVYWEKGGRYPNIITGGQWSPNGFLIFVMDNSCSFRMGKPSKTVIPNAEWNETSAGFGQFTPGQWYHLVATFKHPMIQTYLNGQPVGVAQWDYPVGFAGDLRIGAWDATQICHSGMISGVKLYNRALTAAEVLASYQATAAGHDPVKPGEKAFEKIPAKPATPAVTLENDQTKLLLDDRARVIGLVDKTTRKDYCSTTPANFATIQKAGVAYRPSSCSYHDGKLNLVFGRSGVTAQVKVGVRKRYFVFELASISDPEVTEVVLGGLAVGPSKNVSDSVAWASDGVNAAAVVPLNLQVEVAMTGGMQPAFVPRCVKRYGLVGARVAVAACPTRTMRAMLQEIVRAEGLPYSPLGGPFAQDAEENRGSYLFSTVSETNVDEWIELARRGGFAEIHLCPWWRGLGHYDPNPDLFPHGLAGLKQVADRIHAAGFKVGMHTLTGCIDVSDPWVTPVPDKRLAKDAQFTLAAPVGPDDKVIPTTEFPRGLETFWGDMSTGNTIQIDDEIIAYAGISHDPPYGFTGCTRGQWGTRRAAHDKGAAAGHLVASYCAYIPDEDTSLVDELAGCIARTFNACKADMIYMDGSEGMKTTHAVATMKRAIFAQLKGRVLVESSSGAWGAWPFHSRVGAWDHPKYGFNRFTDLHCESLQSYTANELLPGHMGWWVITGPSPDYAEMFPEDMEYFCGKCLGWDYSSSLEGVEAGRVPPNARQNEYLTMLGRYERLRLARYFSADVQQALRTPKEQFCLAQVADGTWQVRPTDYAAHKVTSLSDDTASWTTRNRFAAQSTKLRIEALYACKPYDGPDSVLLTDFTRPEEFGERASANAATPVLTASTGQIKAGPVSGCLTAKNNSTTRKGAWTKVGKVFTPPLDMTRCGALGVWVYGDGKGELLNFQLNNTREEYTAWDDHYVDVDFTGWRYFELLLRERDAQRHQDYVWPYGGGCEVGRSPVIRGRVGALNIYYNNLPPGEEVKCFIGPVRAVPVTKVTLTNPCVTIGGKRLVFPVALESGQYIEYEGGDCHMYDERGEVLRRIVPQGEVPELGAGDNPAAFACEGPADLNTRAKVTVISAGPPLRNTATVGKVDWSWLHTEYDDLRTILALDGKQNEWDLPCRPSARPASFHVDLTVQRAIPATGTSDAAKPLVIESCEDATRFADTPENKYKQYVYDGEDKSIAAKPGVTVTLERATDVVKTGPASLRFSATSKRDDAAGWCARGQRFPQPLNLADSARLGLWVYGDGGGESLKLQLRDLKGGWLDLITPVDFIGWKRVEFPIGGEAGIDLAHVEYLIVFFNAIPPGRTVTCYLDRIEATREVGGIPRPAFTVNGQSFAFPLTLATGERLVYNGGGEALIYGRDGQVRRRCALAGQPPALKAGPNRVRFSFDSRATPEFSVLAQVVKEYH